MIGKKDMQQEKKEVLGRMLARDLAHLILTLLIGWGYLLSCDKTFRSRLKIVFLVSSFGKGLILGNLDLT